MPWESWTNTHVAPLGRGARQKGQGKGQGKNGKGQGKGQGKGEGKGAKGAAKGTIKIGVCSLGNQRVKCAKSKNGKYFCSFFNVGNNCRSAPGICSGGMHRCNIMTSPSKVCNGSHSAKDHTGASLPAGQG